MRVVMTRTVEVADQAEPYERGVAYDLPDDLARSWVSYGVADCQEAPEPSPEAQDDRTPGSGTESRERAAQRRVKRAEA